MTKLDVSLLRAISILLSTKIKMFRFLNLRLLILTLVIYCQLLFWYISFLVVLTSLVTRLPAMTCVWSVGTLFVNITFLNISIFCNLIFSGQLGPEVTTLPALAEETVISLKCYTCPHCSFVKIIFDLRTIINAQTLSC